MQRPYTHTPCSGHAQRQQDGTARRVVCPAGARRRRRRHAPLERDDDAAEQSLSPVRVPGARRGADGGSPAPSVEPPSPLARFERRAGALTVGNDVGSGIHTLEEAAKRCVELGAVGFTHLFGREDSTGRVVCYFKSSREMNGDEAWLLYVLPEASLPLPLRPEVTQPSLRVAPQGSPVALRVGAYAKTADGMLSVIHRVDRVSSGSEAILRYADGSDALWMPENAPLSEPTTYEVVKYDTDRAVALVRTQAIHLCLRFQGPF